MLLSSVVAPVFVGSSLCELNGLQSMISRPHHPKALAGFFPNHPLDLFPLRMVLYAALLPHRQPLLDMAQPSVGYCQQSRPRERLSRLARAAYVVYRRDSTDAARLQDTRLQNSAHIIDGLKSNVDTEFSVEITSNLRLHRHHKS